MANETEKKDYVEIDGVVDHTKEQKTPILEKNDQR